jgi:hypothetical protein
MIPRAQPTAALRTRTDAQVEQLFSRLSLEQNVVGLR